MASRHLTSDLPKRLFEIQADENDPPHDSGYHSSDGSDRIPRDTNNVLNGTRDGVRPPKKQCLPPPPLVPPRYGCGTCKTLFHAYEDVARHIRADSTICAASDGHWMCGKCNETFTEGKSLKRHVNTTGCTSGTAKPSHKCQSCGRTYTRKDNLERHEKSHQGQSHRKNVKIETTSSSISVEGSPHTTGDSTTPSHSVTSSAQSSDSAKVLPSIGSNDLDLQLPYDAQSWEYPLKLITPNDRPSTMSTTASIGVVASDRHIPLSDSTSTVQHEIPPTFTPPRNSMDLPLRPKYANKRPGPKSKSTKCPSCHKRVGVSQQELEAHAKSHSGGRYSVDLLCMKCMICFEREQDLRHHETSANKYGNCGFLNHKNCGGHHPLAEGEVSANPAGDHARMRFAVQNWQLLELQDYQLRHDEVVEALPDQGEDCERWTWTARSLKAISLWSQRSRPLSKMSAPTSTDYSARTPFRNIADRYQQVKAVAASRNRNKNLQIKRRADLATVGAIMAKDFTALVQMLQEGRNPNTHLYICDTGAARMRYNEKLQKTHEVISPLILASEQGYLDGMSMLICAGADVNAVDDNYRTALDWAMTRHNKMACAVLLAHGARYVDRGDRLGDDAHAFLQSAKDELISALIHQHRMRSHAHPYACYAHHAILNANQNAFRTLLSFGFSLDSRPLCICAEHGCRSFRDMAKNAAPHLLDILPQEVDLELLLEAISTNDVHAIKTLLTPTTILPLSVCSRDVLLGFARTIPGVSQEVVDVLAGAVEGVALSRPPQESFWYSRVGAT